MPKALAFSASLKTLPRMVLTGKTGTGGAGRGPEGGPVQAVIEGVLPGPLPEQADDGNALAGAVDVGDGGRGEAGDRVAGRGEAVGGDRGEDGVAVGVEVGGVIDRRHG